MILKRADDKSAQIAELEALQSVATGATNKKILSELSMLKAGIIGERKSSFYLDDAFKNSNNTYVIHDLRIEHNDRVAQIDHLFINRFLDVYVLETKHAHTGIKISEAGEFTRWNQFQNRAEGMSSPLAQNDRHVDILKEVFDVLIEMPTRLGLTLQPRFYSRVLLNPEARIDRPKKFDTAKVMKADDFYNSYMQEYENAGVFTTVSTIAKFMSSEAVERIAQQLVSLHKPLTPNYAAKFGAGVSLKKIQADSVKAKLPKVTESIPACSKCKSLNINIAYGRFGYYFKCSDCDGNTAIKLNCGVDAHKERLRKEGERFFRECSDCKTSQLYFMNKC